MGLYIIIACLILLIVLLLFKRNNNDNSQLRNDITNEIKTSMKLFSDTLTNSQNVMVNMQNNRLKELSSQLSENQNNLRDNVTELLKSFDEKISAISVSNDKKLEEIRNTMEQKIKTMQEDNSKKLDEMRNVVDEKLHKTLDERIGQSFKIVSERLEQVYKSLGEMQNLAVSVGDLKRTLSNVKTRGIIGEVQLGSILEQILSKEQYEANISTKPNSSYFVEYAVKMPGDGDMPVYLPIDAKFPLDAYNNLVDAYENGAQENIEACSKILETRIKAFAKDINDKYIAPPHTTDFAIMFLPTEGLYAEVVKRDIFEYVQREYNIIIAGPTNMAALLNSLQMGFKTLAIQKRSSEVWMILGAVKTEFDKFAAVLENAQAKIENASNELDKLVGVRTRQIQKKLKAVTYLEDTEAKNVLMIEEEQE